MTATGIGGVSATGGTEAHPYGGVATGRTTNTAAGGDVGATTATGGMSAAGGTSAVGGTIGSWVGFTSSGGLPGSGGASATGVAASSGGMGTWSVAGSTGGIGVGGVYPEGGVRSQAGGGGSLSVASTAGGIAADAGPSTSPSCTPSDGRCIALWMSAINAGYLLAPDEDPEARGTVAEAPDAAPEG